jgi:integrase
MVDVDSVNRQPADGRRKVSVANHPGIFRKGGRYLVTWRHNGRQRARSFRKLSKATRFKGQTVAGDTRPTSREPFRRYATRWLDSYGGRTSRGLSDSTRAHYRDAMMRFALPYFGTARMDEIDPPMIRDFIGHLAAQGLAPASVRRYLAPVRALLATAYEDGIIRSNPAAGVRAVVGDQRVRQRRRLTPDQTRLLLAEMPPEHADLAYLLAATGLRISEALAMRWADLGQDSLSRPVLVIPKSKTPSGERVIPLSPQTVHRLVRCRAESRFPADSDPVFPTDVGSPIDSHNYRRRVFRPAAERAGVPWA